MKVLLKVTFRSGKLTSERMDINGTMKGTEYSSLLMKMYFVWEDHKRRDQGRSGKN